jgi:hypothetical protein
MKAETTRATPFAGMGRGVRAKWARHLCQVALNTRDTVALIHASEMMGSTPRRPRRARPQRKSVRNVSASNAPIAPPAGYGTGMPSTSRLRSPFTPTVMVTATETIRPA